MQDHIYVKGARENNLKNVDVTIHVPGPDGEARRGLH